MALPPWRVGWFCVEIYIIDFSLLTGLRKSVSQGSHSDVSRSGVLRRGHSSCKKHSDHGCTDWVLLWSKLLKSWKQVHWGWHILHNALRMAITVHETVFCHWFCKFRSLYVLYRLWHWFTQSMSKGSAEIHAMYPHHCALHGIVKRFDCLAQGHCVKRLSESTLDWPELLALSCTGERP